MTFLNKKYWNALQVRPRFEAFVARHLAKRNIEHFLPCRQVSPTTEGATKRALLPLLPGFLFTRCNLETERSLVDIPGVLAVTSEDSSRILISGAALGHLRYLKVNNRTPRAVIHTLKGLRDGKLVILPVYRPNTVALSSTGESESRPPF